jgi:hypothetical protein
MQYFLGLDHFTDKPVFDPSLFVTIRKRLGNEVFDEMNRIIISGAPGIEDQSIDNKIIDNSQESNFQGENTIGKGTGLPDEPSPNIPNEGKLQLDGTVRDAYIKYPAHLNLLKEEREKAEELLDKLIKA